MANFGPHEMEFAFSAGIYNRYIPLNYARYY
jgi:hypothetical protein